MAENADVNGSSSSSNDFDDLDALNFPSDVDWSSTLVLRCDPAGGPYNLSDVYNALYEVVRRNEVFNLGPTFLNHVFTISFRTTFALDGFARFLKSGKSPKVVKIKGHACRFVKVPTKTVTIHIRNVPLEVDTSHVIEELKEYGTIVKTQWVKSNFRGWFHVYTNERKFTVSLHPNVKVQDIPYGIEVKGLVAGVFVEERNPKCLECYYSGHKSDVCELKGCILYQNNN